MRCYKIDRDARMNTCAKIIPFLPKKRDFLAKMKGQKKKEKGNKISRISYFTFYFCFFVLIIIIDVL